MHALGLELFLKLERLQLTYNLRCKDDELRHFQEQLRLGNTAGLVNYGRSHLLTSADAAKFAGAPIIAPGNEERNYMNPILLQEFAARRGDRVISWHLPNSLSGYNEPIERTLNNNSIAGKLLTDLNPQLMAHFCAGSPIVYTSNESTERGIANGTPGEQYSLAWTTDKAQRAAQDFIDSNPGNITLPRGLEPVVLARPHLQDALLQKWPSTLTLVPGDIVLPVEVKNEYVNVDGAGAKVVVSIEKPQYDHCFIRTIHKAQGSSLHHMIVSLMRRPGNLKPPPPDFFAFNVAFTRCTTGDELRFLVAQPSDCDYLATLRPPPELLAFMDGYDNTGRWNKQQAFAALLKRREAHAKAKAEHKKHKTKH
jgi:hypothetical protein